MKLKDKLIELIENCDMEMSVSISKGNEGFDVELEWYSDAGEDCFANIMFDGSLSDFQEKLIDYNNQYDDIAYEDLGMWLTLKENKGQPSPERLIADCESKIHYFDKFTEKMVNMIISESI